MQAWLDSDERGRLIAEAADQFGAESHIRKVRGGFDAYFRTGDSAAPRIPIWKENFVVLLVLYPTVFLFGLWVGTPVLTKHFGLPFYLVLFLGNIFSVSMTGWWFISWGNRALSWWLRPKSDAPPWISAAGVALVVALYAICLLIFLDSARRQYKDVRRSAVFPGCRWRLACQTTSNASLAGACSQPAQGLARL